MLKFTWLSESWFVEILRMLIKCKKCATTLYGKKHFQENQLPKCILLQVTSVHGSLVKSTVVMRCGKLVLVLQKTFSSKASRLLAVGFKYFLIMHWWRFCFVLTLTICKVGNCWYPLWLILLSYELWNASLEAFVVVFLIDMLWNVLIDWHRTAWPQEQR